MSVRRADKRSGMALVTVLWTIALLSALAMAASVTFREFAAVVAIDHDRVEADGLLDAGLEVAGDIVAKLGERSLTQRETVITLGSGTVQIAMSDDGGRLDINKAPVPVLAALFRAVGLADQADAVAQAIDVKRQATNKTMPASAPGQSNPQTNPPASPTADPQTNPSPTPVTDETPPTFTDLRQLMQIPGMTPEAVEALAPLATVFGSDKVNLLTAPPGVVAALPGITPGQVSTVLSIRQNGGVADGQLQQMLGPASQYVALKSRPIARVDLSVRTVDGYRSAARAIIVALPKDRLPYRVLEWTPLSVSAADVARMADQP